MKIYYLEDITNGSDVDLYISCGGLFLNIL